MSTGAIIAIIAAVVIVLALLAIVVPRVRGRAAVRAQERELVRRREAAHEMHRVAEEQEQREADRLERESERLEREARARRAEASGHGERAEIHQRGLADEDLVREDEPLADRVRGEGVEPEREVTPEREPGREPRP